MRISDCGLGYLATAIRHLYSVFEILAHDARPTLVIGTHNRKKGAELAELLSPLGFSVVTLDDVPDAIEVVEDGDSFAANARLKASQQAVHLGRWVLADDSGLAVDALGGARACTRPGLLFWVARPESAIGVAIRPRPSQSLRACHPALSTTRTTASCWKNLATRR